MANLSSIITPSNVLTATNTQTVTNKTISGASNTITNVPMASASGTLPVANGGTGATTLTANNVLLGNGTSAPQVVAPGTTGNVLTSNGTTWTSAAPAPSAGTLQAVATGSLSNGSTVIINADGTVSVVQGSTAVVFESANTSNTSATFDSTNNKVVIAYTDSGNSGFGTAIVGTVSGNSISFGTPVVFESANSVGVSCAYDATNQKVVISYADNGNSSYGTAIVGTVSGTSISFGTAAVFYSDTVTSTRAVYNVTGSKVVVAYLGTAIVNDNPTTTGRAIVGTVSGTSISFGSNVAFNNNSTSNIAATYDSTNNRVVVGYTDISNTSNGTARVGTVSGTSISFGTAVVFESASTSDISGTFDSSNNKVVISYADQGNSAYGTAIVGTVSGTSISFGTAVVFESASSSNISATFDSTNNKVVIAYTDGGNSSYGTAIVGTVSGTSISFGTAFLFSGASTGSKGSTYDTANQRVVVSYTNTGNSSFGTAIAFSSTIGVTNLTAENYIGISNAAYTNGQTATIQIVGSVDDAQSGLTAGQSYYVTTAGLLSLTAGVPSVFAGTAVSATKLIIKG